VTVLNREVKANFQQMTWSTDEVDEHERFDYFNDALCKVYANLASTRNRKTTGDFFATVDAVFTGFTVVTRARATTYTTTRTKEQVAESDESDFSLVINYQPRNPMVVQYPKQQIVLHHGQLGVVDHTKPLIIDHPKGLEHSIGTVVLPGEAVEIAAKEYNIDRSKLCSTKVSDHPVVGPLAMATTQSLLNNVTAMNPLEVQLLIDSLARMTVVASATNYEGSALTEKTLKPALLLSIIEYIEHNIESAELSAHSIAAQFGITPRYVYKLFENTEFGFSQFVLRRRLDIAISRLRDPNNIDKTIAAIAFGSGFSDLSHFNRRFKERFGCTPSDCR